MTRYQIKVGCESVDENAFVGCDQLRSLYVPYTFTDEAFEALMDSDITGNDIGHIGHWDRSYVEEVYDTNDYWYDEANTFIDEYGVMYANEGKRQNNMKNKTYYMQHEDELFHYLWLRPEKTGVAVDMFVDDGGTYKIDKHPLLAFLRNDYNSEVAEYIAVAVEEDQKILSVKTNLKITDKDMMAAKQFIRENQKLLQDLADSKLSHSDFFSQLVTFYDDLWTDGFGGVYTADKKRLLRVPNVKRYQIAEGCEETDKEAFEGCRMLECLYVPESFSEQAAEDTFNNMPSTVDYYCYWDRPYVEEVYDVNEYWCDETKTRTDAYGVVYANEGRRLVMATKPKLIGKEYTVPDGVLTICDGAFGFCEDYLELSVPRSIKVIGDYIFGKEGGIIVIRD